MPWPGMRISAAYPPYGEQTFHSNSNNNNTVQFDQREIPPYFQNTADNVLRLFGDLAAEDCRQLVKSSASVPSHYRSQGLCGNRSADNSSFSTALQTETATLGFSLSAQVVTGVFTMLCSLVTVVGNLMVLFSFLIERSLRQATNYFIFSLAITDVLIGLLSMNFYSLYIAMGRWPLGELTCDLWLALDFTVCLASQYTVFFITVDRFCSVTVPTAYRNWRTDGKLLTMALGSWIVPISIFFPVIIGWPYFAGRKRKNSECYADFQENAWFTIGLTVCYYWVTLIVMLSLYVEIYKVALRLQNKSEQKRQKVQTAFQKAAKPRASLAHAGKANSRTAVPGSSSHSKKQAAVLPTRKGRRPTGQEEKSSSGALGSESDQQSDESKDKKTSSDRSGPEGKALLPERNKCPDAGPADSYVDCEGLDRPLRGHVAAQRTDSGGTEQAGVSSKFAKLKSRVVGAKTRGQSEKQSAQKTENRARKALKTITFIMGCFVACWTPYHIVVLIDSICKVRSENPDTFESVINVHINNMSYWLCYLNSPINPFCYAFVNVQFKKAFLRILRLDLRIR